MACVREIASKAQESPSIADTDEELKKAALALPDTIPAFYPLTSDLELFQYRVGNDKFHFIQWIRIESYKLRILILVS